MRLLERYREEGLIESYLIPTDPSVSHVLLVKKKEVDSRILGNGPP
jgi:hypothetical protein